MAQAALRHIVLGLATTGLLMGCVQGNGTAIPSPSGSAAPSRAAATGDVEAPEVFLATDSALWDGRPSLGGIWVAAPDVQDPERVVMFNPATGKSVQGALFRRERDNPGPRLQISSDAAEALGILAGQPVEIRVTALRRVEPEPAPEILPPVVDTAVAGAEVPSAGEEPAADGDAAATAAAATAALAATGAGVLEGLPGDGAAPVTEGTEVGAEAPATGAASAEPPKRKTWKERRAEAKAAREAKKAAAAAAAAGVAVDAAAPDAIEVPATAEAVAVEEVAVTPLDGAPLGAPSADAPAAAAAADPAEDVAVEAATDPVVEPPKTRRQRRAEEAAAKAAAETAAAAAAAAPPAEAAAPAGRAIQVASFTKEANADRAVEALAKIGIVGQTRKTETNGKVVWGVVTTGDEAQLKAIKGFGFADAFFLQ